MEEFIAELGIGCVYDNYTFNGGVGNPYLVYKEKKIYTSYGKDIKVGEKLSPYYCISEIIFNESLRVNPEFVIIDNSSVSKIKEYATRGQYKKGTWLDSTIIVFEKGEKAELVLDHEKPRKWPASMFSKKNKPERDNHKSDGLEGIVEKKKLPRMDCYRPNDLLKDSNIEQRTTLFIEN
jgi:hypothetical protein